MRLKTKLKANLLCGFIVGVLAGYKVSMAYLRYEGIDPKVPNQDPYPWALVCIALMLVVPFVSCLVFNAVASAILLCTGKISRAEMWSMMLRLKLPMSLQ